MSGKWLIYNDKELQDDVVDFAGRHAWHKY